MSHRVDIVTQFKNVQALKAACDALKIPYKEGKQKVEVYRTTVACDFSVQLPGWNYPMAIDLKAGKASFDNYNNHWGKIEEFQNLNQEYGLQVAQREPDIRQLIQDGWQPVHEVLENGDRHLVLRKE